MFVSGDDGTTEWDIRTGKSIRQFTPAPDPAGEGFISPNSRYLAEIGDTALRLWDIADKMQLLNVNNVTMEEAVTFSVDSKLIYIGAANRLMVWDIEKATELVGFDPVESGGYRGIFSPDNKYLLTHSALAFGDVVVVWSLETGKKIYTYKPAGGAYPVQFSADSQRLMLVDSSNNTNNPNILRIIDFHLGRDISKFILSAEYRSAFSPNGQFYFSLEDNALGTLRVWNVATGQNQVWC